VASTHLAFTHPMPGQSKISRTRPPRKRRLILKLSLYRIDHFILCAGPEPSGRSWQAFCQRDAERLHLHNNPAVQLQGILPRRANPRAIHRFRLSQVVAFATTTTSRVIGSKFIFPTYVIGRPKREGGGTTVFGPWLQLPQCSAMSPTEGA
jgi:hypothetical protein